jgi:murein DD-endopeptidase MepM/ murein hydrolase activator NlpD
MIIKPSNTLKIRHHKVLDAYFAERINTPQYKSSDEKEPVKHKVVSGDTLSKIAKKYSTTVAKIKADNGLTSDTIYVGKTLSIGSQPKKEKIGDKVTFKSLKSANLGDEVYVVVKTLNLANKKVWLNVNQGKEKGVVEKDTPMTLQKEDKELTRPEAIVGAYAKDDKITNKTDFKDWAIFKITLGGKDTKKEREALDKLKGKKTFMYLLIDAHSPNNVKVVYNGKNPDKEGEPDKRNTPNYWLDIDGKWFELKKGCDCGEEDFNKKFECTRYGTAYGPVYWGSEKLADYKYWDKLIKEKKVTKEEKEILVGMSENEGKLDSVQSYDSEILTVGAMQKTVNSKGKGEFTIQVEEFKKNNPNKYKELFENCGWTVEGGIMYYKDPSDSNSTKITGKKLKLKIREGFKSTEFKKMLKCKPLESIVKASKDEDFKIKQVQDFIDRLKKKVLPIKPKGYNYSLDNYLKSNLGKATILDHHINRPAYVKTDFGKALDNFFSKKNKEIEEFNKKEKDKSKHKTKISKNPIEWGESHSDYEKEILDDYGVNRRGTDMKNRYNKMKDKF